MINSRDRDSTPTRFGFRARIVPPPPARPRVGCCLAGVVLPGGVAPRPRAPCGVARPAVDPAPRAAGAGLCARLGPMSAGSHVGLTRSHLTDRDTSKDNARGNKALVLSLGLCTFISYFPGLFRPGRGARGEGINRENRTLVNYVTRRHDCLELGSYTNDPTPGTIT